MDPILPWYIAGPLIGLVVPILLLFGGKVFGVSSNLRHACAAVPVPARAKPGFLRYDWRRTGGWNLIFVLGTAIGAALSVGALGVPDSGGNISAATQADLRALGITNLSGLVPADLLSWEALASPAGLLVIVLGGFLVGFGARWAGGCTSGHAISGMAALQVQSLVAVVGFFAGGLLITWVLLPLLFG
ncbi:YeeE/YedE family protein [soil metagenome]